MPLFHTPDGRYTVAWETPGEGDGQSVIYDHWRGNPPLGLPIWDRWTYEADLIARGIQVQPPTDTDLPPIPAPPTPPPVPARGGVGWDHIQVTNESDGPLLNTGYSYWPQAWIGGSHVFVFVGHEDGHPRFFEVHLQTGEITRLGAWAGFSGTGEGWYWDRAGGIYMVDGPRLTRVDPFTKQAQVVMDISESHPGCDLWQAHSSDDGQVHSATVRKVVQEGRYPYVGTIVLRQGQEEYFPAHGDLDESQIDPTGTMLVIKETLEDGLSNRIINLITRETQLLRKADGAVGHSDCGPMLLVGEWSPPPGPDHGQCVRWDLSQPLTPGRRVELYPTWNLGHISVQAGIGLVTDNVALWKLDLTTGVRHHLVDHGMVGDGYYFQVFGNLDSTGQVAAYVSNSGGGRLDLFLKRV